MYRRSIAPSQERTQVLWRRLTPASESSCRSSGFGARPIESAGYRQSSAPLDQRLQQQLWTSAVLAACAGCEPEEVRFESNEHGKPRRASPPEARRLRFNLSHSGDLWVLAVSRSEEVGQDSDRLRPRDMDAIRRDWQSAAEAAQLAATEPVDRLPASCEISRRKEAPANALGTGIDAEFVSLEVLDDQPTADWKRWDLPLPSGYSGALETSQRQQQPELIECR